MKKFLVFVLVIVFCTGSLAQTHSEKAECLSKIYSGEGPFREYIKANLNVDSDIPVKQLSWLAAGLEAKYCECLSDFDGKRSIARSLKRYKAEVESVGGIPLEIPTDDVYRSKCEPNSNEYIASLLVNKVYEKIPEPKADSESTTLESIGVKSIPKYYALVIGTSQSGSTIKNTFVEDAERLANTLTRDYNFDEENVTLLRYATYQQIIDAFNQLAQTMTKDDNLLICYSGSGYHDTKTGIMYWKSTDSQPGLDRTNYIDVVQIRNIIKSIKARHILLITDTSFNDGPLVENRLPVIPSVSLQTQYSKANRSALVGGGINTFTNDQPFFPTLFKELEENRNIFLSAPTLLARIYPPILNKDAYNSPLLSTINECNDEGGEFIFIRRDVKLSK